METFFEEKKTNEEKTIKRIRRGKLEVKVRKCYFFQELGEIGEW